MWLWLEHTYFKNARNLKKEQISSQPVEIYYLQL